MPLSLDNLKKKEQIHNSLVDRFMSPKLINRIADINQIDNFLTKGSVRAL